MIITRSPLRISLGGGGTDLPSYYQEHSGFLIAAAIDKYVYITLHQTFVPGTDRQVFARWKRGQRSTRCSIRSSAKRCSCWTWRRRIWKSPAWPTFRPGPAWALRAVSPRRCSRPCTAYKKNLVHPGELAEQACHIEIDILERADRQAGPVHRRLRRASLASGSCPTARWRPGR